MSVWTLATWLAIGVLIVGSLAVFTWFCVDLVRLYRAIRPDPSNPATRGADDPNSLPPS